MIKNIYNFIIIVAICPATLHLQQLGIKFPQYLWTTEQFLTEMR